MEEKMKKMASQLPIMSFVVMGVMHVILFMVVCMMCSALFGILGIPMALAIAYGYWLYGEPMWTKMAQTSDTIVEKLKANGYSI